MSAENQLGLQRFKSGIEFQKELMSVTRAMQDRMLRGLPSNYPRDPNTNLAEYFRAVAKEFARLQISASEINEDKFHDSTRIEYLFQILGDSLFLGNRVINENIDDVSYRNFLIRVRNAYFGGSRKENIEGAVSDILGLPVKLKEVYLELRKGDSAYSKKDMHKMFFDIMMDDDHQSRTIGPLIESIQFFIELLKPAHVLYNTRLVWNDELRKGNGGSGPSYITRTIDYEVYGIEKLYLVTNTVSVMYKGDPDPEETGLVSGIVDTVNTLSGIVVLSNNTILVISKISELFQYSSETGSVPIGTDSFVPGDTVFYRAEEIGSEKSVVMDESWQYSAVVAEIHPADRLLYFDDGSIGVYNENLLLYTGDTAGEYRFDLGEKDLVGFKVRLKAEKHTRGFQFYTKSGEEQTGPAVPDEIKQNTYRQYDPDLIKRPRFQDYVQKERDNEAGYDLKVEGGILTVVPRTSRFFKRKNSEVYGDTEVLKYSLYVNDDYITEFRRQDPQRYLTDEEAKEEFRNMGYTEVDGSEEIRIEVTRTGILSGTAEEVSVQAVGGSTFPDDQSHSRYLVTGYEDTRKDFSWPEPQEVETALESVPDQLNTFRIHTSGISDVLPVLNASGEIAEVQDVKLIIDREVQSGGISSVDPWEGIIVLDTDPGDSAVSVKYHTARRFPDRITYVKKSGHKVPERASSLDLSASFEVINEGGAVNRLNWPFEVDAAIRGDELDHQMDKFPILSRNGHLASSSDVTVYLGTQISSGRLTLTRTSPSELTAVCSEGTFEGAVPGDILLLPVFSEKDITLSISSVDSGNLQCTIFDEYFSEEGAYDFSVVRYIEVTEAVSDIRPLLGHVRLNFIPPAKSFLKFTYYYTDSEREFLMVPDSEENELYGSFGYTPDTVYGPRFRYTVSADGGSSDIGRPLQKKEEHLKIGYRYRAFRLDETSVLNSRTLELNGKDGVLGRASVMFSPEFLSDSDRNIKLNDEYLDKNLKPVTELNPGTPIFEKTFTDSGKFIRTRYPDGIDTYSEPTANSLDLKAEFSVIQKDESGLRDYRGLDKAGVAPEFKLYSDLKIVEHPNGGYETDLSSVNDEGTSFPFKIAMQERYYPNRELRLSDYLDYIDQIPSEQKTGSFYALKGSDIIKSAGDVNFLTLRKGDQFRISFPVESGEGMDVQSYTLLEVLDHQTGRLHRKFNRPSGLYSYELTRSTTVAVDTTLGEINTKLVLNNETGFTYGMSQKIVSRMPEGYYLSFKEPEPPEYPHDTEDFTSAEDDISGLSPMVAVIDGKECIFDRVSPTDEWTGFEGERDVYITSTGVSCKEPEYRIRWRNWDQILMFFSFNGGQIIEEDPVSPLDDVGEGIKFSFWDVNNTQIEDMYFSGSVIMSSEADIDEVDPADYPAGLVRLSFDDAEDIRDSDDPVNDLPHLGLQQSTYRLRRLIVREILADDQLRVTEIQQLVPIF